ncbi:MAG: ATP-binding cassette domain-containing protein [Moraxellaceae bacterium]|nr:MAG: ATP-binding cassette domain-containing protein [Moraxellaceae bacterium]
MLNCDFSYQRAEFRLNVALATRTQVTGILGASGAGKSSFLKIIAGLLKPQSGYIHFNQQVFFAQAERVVMPSYQRHVGLVFQDGQLFPHLNVQQNLLYGYQRIRPEQRCFELDHIVQLLELEALVTRNTHQLSGGEAQRVALGRALLYSPQLLLLDEPLSALDGRLKQHILPFLARIRDETKIPMLYVTHQPAELEFLQADILHIDQGQLRAG